MRPLRIALGDLSYFTEGNFGNLYVPLNLGYLASYVKAKFGRDVEIKLKKKPSEMLSLVRDERPDLIGLSAYYWQEELNKLFVRKVRAMTGYHPMIVIGGPSVDSDLAEQDDYLRRHPGVDRLVVNEGEDGLATVVGTLLGGSDASVAITHPERVGLSTDLASVPSPYLDGTLDEFLNGPFQPMIQTSRLCPYTCSFCVSGKSRGKLRVFPMEQVNEEVKFIASRFADRPDHILYIVDENFGILGRDVDVAKTIRASMDSAGYPKRVFYYNDKRFTQTSRDVQEVLGDACHHGVCLSLQSENPETLKAIRRRNLTDNDIRSAIAWAHGLGLTVSTELIFGLPCETRASFLALLDKCARLGFDKVQCYNLIVFDGIEMNRQAYRDEHKLVTKRRPINAHSLVLNGEACAETEEVVVQSSSISFDDYRLVRAMNVMFHAVFVLGVHREFFRELVDSGQSLTAFFERFLTPMCDDDPIGNAHCRFLYELDAAIRKELGGHALHDGRVVKIQPVFASKLAKATWVPEVIARIARQRVEVAA